MCITYKGFEIHYSQGSQLLEEYVPPVVAIAANSSARPNNEKSGTQEICLSSGATASEAYKLARDWIDKFYALAGQSDYQHSDQEQLWLEHHEKELLPQLPVPRKFQCHSFPAIAHSGDGVAQS